jgi:hypothetical protein
MQESGATILFVSHDSHAIRALCTRAILLHAGRMETDGAPTKVLNRYQKLIMSREADYEATQSAAVETDNIDHLLREDKTSAPLHYTYRHGDGTAEILSVDVMDASHKPIKIAETGESLLLRVRARFNNEVDDPVCGFLIRNRLGIHVYGTNTEIQQMDFGRIRAGEVIEVIFAFNCWLGVGEFSITVALHSAGGVSFDWVDDVMFLRVISPITIEGVANLNAGVTMRRLGVQASRAKTTV